MASYRDLPIQVKERLALLLSDKNLVALAGTSHNDRTIAAVERERRKAYNQYLLHREDYEKQRRAAAYIQRKRRERKPLGKKLWLHRNYTKPWTVVSGVRDLIQGDMIEEDVFPIARDLAGATKEQLILAAVYQPVTNIQKFAEALSNFVQNVYHYSSYIQASALYQFYRTQIDRDTRSSVLATEPRVFINKGHNDIRVALTTVCKLMRFLRDNISQKVLLQAVFENILEVVDDPDTHCRLMHTWFAQGCPHPLNACFQN